MSELLDGAEGSPDEIVEMILLEISKMFDDKRVAVTGLRRQRHAHEDRYGTNGLPQRPLFNRELKALTIWPSV